MDKIIYNVSSYNRPETLIKTIESIYNQADIINVSLNGYSEIPIELYDNKINILLTNNERGDAYKFYNLNSSEGYYLTIDDDLIYPSNYSQFMIENIEKYNRKSFITLHSRTFNSIPIKNYYSNAATIHFAEKSLTDTKVHFGGTGVMGFHTDLAKIDIKYFEHPNMADIWIGLYASQNSIDIINVAHEKSYIKQQEITNSIYSTHKRDDKIQTIVANRVFIPNHNISSQSISVIIPTFNNVEYIDECLGSVLSSVENLDYEILVGIDGCTKTLDYILKNREKYPKTIKFYNFEKNVGPYVVKNTLSLNAKFDNILFFDSDDILKNNLITIGLDKLNNEGFDVIMPKFINFDKEFDYEKVSKNSFVTHDSVGIFIIKKDLFLRMNGYEPWLCAADTEFFERLFGSKQKIYMISEACFYRRLHSSGLTNRADTKHGSDIRKKYTEIIKQKRLSRNFQPLNKLEIHDYQELTDDFNYDDNLLVHENQSNNKTNQQSVLEILSNNDLNRKKIVKNDENTNKRNQIDLVKLLLTNTRTVAPTNNTIRGTRVGRIK